MSEPDLMSLLLEADRILRIAEAHAYKARLVYRAATEHGPASHDPWDHPGRDLRLSHETREFAWTFSEPLPPKGDENRAAPEGERPPSEVRALLRKIAAAYTLRAL